MDAPEVLPELAQGTYAAYEVTLRTEDGTPIATGLSPYPYDGTEAFAAVLWPGDGTASLATPEAAWSAGGANGDHTDGIVSVRVLPASTAALAPGRYQLRVAMDPGDGNGQVVWRAILPVVASPGSQPALATYHTYDEQLRTSPWMEELEGRHGRAGFEEERHEARQELEELCHARYRGPDMGCGPAANHHGYDHRQGASGPVRSTDLQDLLDEDRLVVSKDCLDFLRHLAAGIVARRQIGPGADSQYEKLAVHHEREAGRLAGRLLIGIDTTTPADGVADLFINCADRRVGRG